MVIRAAESLGARIRRRRRKLGLTLGELAAKSGVSKPYLSVIENDRVVNPPNDEKLLKLEEVLGFGGSELVGLAHLLRTPPDVRAMLVKLSAAARAVREAAMTFQPAAMMRISGEAVGCPEVKDKDSFAVRVSDDSMTPKYQPGDYVIFSPAAAARDGDDCFVRLSDGNTAFHRVFFESGEEGEPVIRLQPRNERHRAVTVPAERVAAMHRAVFKYQRVEEG